MSITDDPAEPNEHVTVVEAFAFKLRRSMTHAGLAERHAVLIAEDVVRLAKAIVQEALPISSPGPASAPAPVLPTIELVDAVRTLFGCEWSTANGRATVNADAFLAVRLALIERDRRVSPVFAPAPAPALPTIELVDAVRALCVDGHEAVMLASAIAVKTKKILPGFVIVKLNAFQAVRAALAERDNRSAPTHPPALPTKPSIGVLVSQSLMDRVEELTTQLREQAIELTAQLREQAMHLDERMTRIEDLERNLGRVEAERQGLADQLARPPSIRAVEQALLRDLSRADLPDGHYVPRYGPNVGDNMVCSDGHVILATGDGEQGSDILYLSIYPAARDVAGRSMGQSAKLSAVARLLWNASRLVNERTR